MENSNTPESVSIPSYPTLDHNEWMNLSHDRCIIHQQRDYNFIHQQSSEIQNLKTYIKCISSQYNSQLTQANKDISDTLMRNVQLGIRADKHEAHLKMLEDEVVHKNQEITRLTKLLCQKENDFEVEVMALERKIKLMQQRFAQLSQKESISARMKNMHLERERNIAEQNVAVLHKKLQEKEVKIFKLTEQLKQSKEHNVARFHDLERPTREAFTDAEISLKKGKKRVLEVFKNEKKRKSPCIFKRFWAWLCRGMKGKKKTKKYEDILEEKIQCPQCSIVYSLSEVQDLVYHLDSCNAHHTRNNRRVSSFTSLMS
uniref:Uncharacterized protein n=1 Tax=Eptatretus burgeri TaxID=7764 RepID=A0A8C4QUI0_EPTBU